MLGLQPGDKLRYILRDGEVRILRAEKRAKVDALSSTLYIFGSGPSPEDALVGYELERLVEGQHDTAHVIDVLPSSPV